MLIWGFNGSCLDQNSFNLVLLDVDFDHGVVEGLVLSLDIGNALVELEFFVVEGQTIFQHFNREPVDDCELVVVDVELVDCHNSSEVYAEFHFNRLNLIL